MFLFLLLKGFSARGDKTLTSQLIVLKNINKELQLTQKSLLTMYEDVKRREKIHSRVNKDKKRQISDNSDNQEPIEEDAEGLSYEDVDDGEEVENEISENVDDSPSSESLSVNNMLEQIVWKNFNGAQLLQMLPKNKIDENNEAFSKIEHCEYNLNLGKNKLRDIIFSIHRFISKIIF